MLAAHPDHPTALHLLGLLAHQVGRHDDACRLIERAIAVHPTAADFHFHLAEARFAAGAIDAAEASYRRAIELQPDHAAAHNSLGHLLFTRQRFDEAMDCFSRAIAIVPGFAQAHCNLGTALMVKGRYADAVAPLRRAVELDEKHAIAHVNLSMALQSMHRVDEAADVLERAVPLMPAPALNALGLLRMEQGRLVDAIDCFRRSLALDSGNADAHSNLLLVLNHAEDISRDEFFREHLRWAEKFETPLIALRRPHANDRSPDRRLRIGYVSPDFRQHPVGFFIEPAIAGHHREQFEIFCYSEIGENADDDLTRRLQRSADGWRVIAGLDDDRVAQMIRDDAIDILVDLAGHTARNRLRVFARKPAPVQVTYLGYSATTGLRAMDYLIGDAFLTPPGVHDAHATERIVQLPRAYVCYTPGADLPAVGPLPAESRGYITFGSVNRLSKVTPRAFEAWAEIVQRTPNSKLLLHADAGRHLDAVRKRWQQLGLALDRLEIVHRIALDQYFSLFNRIDIALDPFPHNGGKTTRDALIMGVPVVTFCGDLPITRAGLSCLAPLDLTELVAYSTEQYVTIATELAADLPRLAELRRTLRPRMLASSLTDAPAYVADLEDAYRTMWQKWCAGGYDGGSHD
ncbi:MAG: protein O-GlcNAc transferase [Humisphaera sp.]|nr:protein O-GlcNAc transferase [Humisphaera sp.]